MPSYTNIQSYQKLEGQDYAAVLQRFQRVLEAIGLWNERIAHDFQGFSLNVDDWGNVTYSFQRDGGLQINGYMHDLADIPMIPVLAAISRYAPEDKVEIWLECGFWIDDGYLIDYDEYRFLPEVFQFIPALMEAMAKEFPERPIYLTNELSDGKPKEFVIHGRQSEKWEFDFAWIPAPYFAEYLSPPSTHTVSMKGNHLEASHLEHWKPEPEIGPGL